MDIKFWKWKIDKAVEFILKNPEQLDTISLAEMYKLEDVVIGSVMKKLELQQRQEEKSRND